MRISGNEFKCNSWVRLTWKEHSRPCFVSAEILGFLFWWSIIGLGFRRQVCSVPQSVLECITQAGLTDTALLPQPPGYWESTGTHHHVGLVGLLYPPFWNTCQIYFGSYCFYQNVGSKRTGAMIVWHPLYPVPSHPWNMGGVLSICEVNSWWNWPGSDSASSLRNCSSKLGNSVVRSAWCPKWKVPSKQRKREASCLA